MTNTFLGKDKNNEIIAKNFYEFLIGKKNYLIPFDTLAKIANTIDNNILSIGYGMVVVIDKDANIRVNYEEPISKNKVRCSIITATKANERINFEGHETECLMSFDTSRVKFLQKYLAKYQELQLPDMKKSTRKK